MYFRGYLTKTDERTGAGVQHGNFKTDNGLFSEMENGTSPARANLGLLIARRPTPNRQTQRPQHGINDGK